MGVDWGGVVIAWHCISQRYPQHLDSVRQLNHVYTQFETCASRVLQLKQLWKS